MNRTTRAGLEIATYSREIPLTRWDQSVSRALVYAVFGHRCWRVSSQNEQLRCRTLGNNTSLCSTPKNASNILNVLHKMALLLWFQTTGIRRAHSAIHLWNILCYFSQIGNKAAFSWTIKLPHCSVISVQILCLDLRTSLYLRATALLWCES